VIKDVRRDRQQEGLKAVLNSFRSPGCSSVVEHMVSMPEAWGSIPVIIKRSLDYLDHHFWDWRKFHKILIL
jgi:hypothetical protein